MKFRKLFRKGDSMSEKSIKRVKLPVRTIAMLFLLLTVRSALSDTVTVTTQYGPVKGLRDSGMTAFLSIPYAKPPVGSLRWKAPVAPAAWASAVDAMNYPPECPQMQFTQGSDTGIYKGSEDCLFLCVWAPAAAADLPVMVFIHGGGNQQGSVTMMHDGAYMYDGRYLSQHENIIVVSLQYRLGSLGFLAHPGLAAEDSHGSSGDYGLLDQIFALQWVKCNIRAFGGDSTRVTIFGQSAGGMDIDNLLVSPPAGGLSVELSKAHTISRIAVTDIRGRELGRVFPKGNRSLYHWDVPSGIYVVQLYGTDGSRAALTGCVTR